MFTARLFALASIVTTLFALTLSGVSHASQGQGWTLRFGAAVGEPDGELEVSTDSTRLRTEANTAYGTAVSAEYRFSSRLGLEIGTMVFWDSDIDIRVQIDDDGDSQTVVVGDSLGFVPITGGLNVHLTPNSRADLFVGPSVSYIRYADFSFGSVSNVTVNVDGTTVDVSSELPSRLLIDDDFAFGVVLGLDAPIGGRGWLFHASLRYLATSIDAGVADLDYDPLILGLGFGYKFGS